MRKILAVAVLGVLFCCLYQVAPVEAANRVDPRASFIQMMNQMPVEPYEGVDVQVGLRGSGGAPLLEAPVAGSKLYIWTTQEGAISPHMDLLTRSVPEGVYLHATAHPGVLIMDGPGLVADRSFRIQFTQGGTYDLHGVYLTEGGFDPSAAADFWPYLLTGASSDLRQIQVYPTPGRDVGYMTIHPSIDGLEQPAQLVYGDNQLLYEGVQVPVAGNGTTPTRVTVTLTRANGLSVGPDVPVQAEVRGTGVHLDTRDARTDAQGKAVFHLQGLSDVAASVTFSVPGGQLATMPIRSYTYQPQTVRVAIGEERMDVDGRVVPMDTRAVIVKGRTYLPFRAIGEILGAEIEFNPTIRTITTTLDAQVITMTIGFDRYAVDGVVRTMDAVPYINTDSRTMVPVRFVAEATGYEVEAVTDAQGLTSAVLITRAAS